jgi:triacylglycerol esterase/lipase EstA (alpha/beta hydrolase family)
MGASWAGLAPRRRLLLGGIALVLVIVVAIVVVRAVAGRDGVRSGYPDQGRPGPVLLVPGYGGGQTGLNALAARIRATGRSATVLSLPGDGTGDLVEQAAILNKAVTEALRQGAPSVDLVGYSAGGVVVLLWTVRYGGEHSARRVVTLGSPLHGARIAATGAALAPGLCPTACQQLAPGSSLLAEIDRSRVPDRLPWLSIWTRDDQTVQPPESAQLPGAVNVAVQDVCPDAPVQHGQLPTDALVTGMVLRATGTATVAAPRPADCAGLRAA